MEKKNRMESFGREAGLGVSSQGIPSYNKEPSDAKLVSLSNKFSAQHDVSMDEALRMCGGAGTSAQANMKKGSY